MFLKTEEKSSKASAHFALGKIGLLLQSSSKNDDWWWWLYDYSRLFTIWPNTVGGQAG